MYFWGMLFTKQLYKVSIFCVVNRNKDKAIKTDIINQSGDFTGSFEVFEVNGPDIKAENDFGKEPVKTVEKPAVKAKGPVVTYDFPPHSFTLLRGEIK